MKVEVDALRPNSPYGICGRKAAFEEEDTNIKAQELCESRGGRPGLPVPNSPYGLCGRKATLNERVMSNRFRTFDVTRVALLVKELTDFPDLKLNTGI